MEIISTVLTIYVLIAVSVTFHELGHYVKAKQLGSTVNVFNVGIGPALMRFSHSETSVSFKLIPLGGFIEMDEDRFDYDRFTGDIPVFKKAMRDDAAILFAGPLANLMLAVVSFVVMVSLIAFNVLSEIPSETIHAIAGIAFSSTTINLIGFIVNLLPLKGSDGSHLIKIFKAHRLLKKKVDSLEAKSKNSSVVALTG